MRLFARKKLAVGAAAVAIVAGAGAAVTALLGSPHPDSSVAGTLLDRPLPLLDLTDQNGRRFDLAASRRIVVLAPFLTLCQESCPLTTGAFKQLEAKLVDRGLSGRVDLVEATVDPQRDTAARLRAFARLAGIHYTLATGKPTQIAQLWRFLGVSVFRKGEGTPPGTDWLTGKPLAYDVVHTDALFLLGTDGHERIIVGGMATIRTLPAALKNLLSQQGLRDLHQPSPGWSIDQALNDISYLAGSSAA